MIPKQCFTTGIYLIPHTILKFLLVLEFWSALISSVLFYVKSHWYVTYLTLTVESISQSKVMKGFTLKAKLVLLRPLYLLTSGTLAHRACRNTLRASDKRLGGWRVPNPSNGLAKSFFTGKGLKCIKGLTERENKCNICNLKNHLITSHINKSTFTDSW